ncbi:MAG: CHAT domain-containing tetratricopeptide repeat protein [Bryobacteraceae bacterium]
MATAIRAETAGNTRVAVNALVVLFVILAGCGASPDSHYKNGRLLLRQGKLPEAMREADAGMKAESSWRFRILKADVLLARGESNAARQLLASAAPPSDQESLARIKMDEGWAENLASNYSRAEALLQQASRIAVGLPLLEATIEYRIGAVQARQGRMDLSEQTLRHVVAVTAAYHDPYLQATAMGNLGLMFQKAFQFEEAIYWFDKAGAMFQQIGSMNSYYITVGNLGWCYHRLGDSDKALLNFQQAEMHARQIGDRFNEQIWVGNSGSVLYARGDFRGAAQKFKQALDLAQSLGTDEKDNTGWWYYNLASTWIDLGDFEQAASYNQEALNRRQALADHSDFYPRVNEAHIAAGRRDPRAEALYRGLIAEYHDGLNPVPMLEAQAGLAALLAEKAEFQQADAQFRAALTRLESQRTALSSADNRISYLASLIRFYDRYINFLVDRHQPERALEVAESSRARVLDERMQSKSAHATVSAARMRELARASDSVFLSYWLGKKKSFLWAVTPDGITLHDLPPESEIAPLVAGYRSFLENLRDPLQSEYPAGRKLAEILLGPVRPLLSSAHRVVLVPDRSLYSLNFETLPDPENSSKYLIERAAIEVAPSLDVLADPRASSPSSESLLLIGNPEQAVEEFPRLPFAGNEIEAISKVFPPGKQTVLAGAKAYPDAYREAGPAQFSWIHFAAHAAANRTSPLDSALILSRGESSYQLSARDVMNVPLNARLVTLSACRSAGAKTFSGEGQVGLSWAFLRAGARSVVAGLWDVTDRSTAELMADFYDQLSHSVAPVDALRHAKLTLLRGGGAYQKPFYWGPFQMYAGAI